MYGSEKKMDMQTMGLSVYAKGLYEEMSQFPACSMTQKQVQVMLPTMCNQDLKKKTKKNAHVGGSVLAAAASDSTAAVTAATQQHWNKNRTD